MHVHVAVDGPDKCIAVLTAMLNHLGELLALSASSPFWRGEQTGLESTRQMVFAAFPRSGVPPRFADYEEYATVVGQLEKTGCIADYTHIWWDIRPHPKWGTIEIRVMDAVTRVEDAVAIAAYIQSLVKRYCDDYDAGRALPTFHRMLVTENKWLAGRYGLEAPVMDLVTGRRNRAPIAQLIRRTLREIEPHARELGSDRELGGIAEILSRGNSADPAAPRLQREPRHRRGRPRDRRRDRAGGNGAGRSVIAVGEKAPNPTLLAAPGEAVRLHDLAPPGEGILLLFYLFDWSATCTDELLLLRERRADLEAAGFTPFGVSRDSPWSHVAWREALDLDIALLSDWEAEAIRAFGLAHEFRGLTDVAERSCFLVDGDRTVRWVRKYATGEVPDMDEMVAAAREVGS